ncbi:MAG TPA: hypothetical protein VG387_13360 [Rhizomicrobium sp.]|nr:hypothetical protein [Rhizomicrobium sp.]
MKIRHALLGAFAALALGACVTPYAPEGITGGYSETQVDDTTWQVTFAGNGNTTPETVQTFWLYRCAELTLDKGYDGFEVAPDVRLVHDIHPANDGAVLIQVHGGGGGGGGHSGGGGHGGGSHGGSRTYIYTPIYIYGGNKPVLTARIHMIKKPFADSPPARFDALKLQQTLEPLVKENLCQGNVCPHPHTYLGTPQPMPGEAPTESQQRSTKAGI